ncbi:MAG: hypothetical protein KJ593_01710 [Candidatus Omnitrophica bacterium]|nr:hypothetical protein [Candidatus Omnitrophota bacterium]
MLIHSRRRNILGIFIIIVVAVFGLLAFKLVRSGGLDGLRTNIASDRQDLKTQFEIVRANTRDLISPLRKPPYSTLAPQATLAQMLPQAFAEFQEDDWRYFWELIYGVHETDDYGSNYTPKRKRQLSIEEIKETLSYDYPEVFGRFNGQMWEEFWKVVFKKY